MLFLANVKMLPLNVRPSNRSRVFVVAPELSSHSISPPRGVTARLSGFSQSAALASCRSV